MTRRPLSVAILVWLSFSASGGLVDFESIAPTHSSQQSVYSPGGTGYFSLPLIDGGVTGTLTRTSGLAFDVMNTTGLARPASWGNRSLHSLRGGGNTQDRFLLNFSGDMVTSFSIEGGNIEAGRSGNLYVQAWSGPNGSGTLLSTVIRFCPDSFGNGALPQLLSTGVVSQIRSIVFWAEMSRPQPQGGVGNAAFWDNIRLTSESVVIPAPESFVLAVPGLIVLLARRRVFS